MVIIINKNTTRQEIESVLKKFHQPKKKKLISFFGRLKDSFGDGLEYQKKVRG